MNGLSSAMSSISSALTLSMPGELLLFRRFIAFRMLSQWNSASVSKFCSSLEGTWHVPSRRT
eukprot:scaffold13512_cov87-Phaeocystis_antarctica.AAC.1